MSKKDQDPKDEVGVEGFAKIARGLSGLFDVLGDFERLPRRGRHEKDGRVMEYSFTTRPLGEAAESAPSRKNLRRAPNRRAGRRRRAGSSSSSRPPTSSTSRTRSSCCSNCRASSARRSAACSKATFCCSRRKPAIGSTARKR